MLQRYRAVAIALPLILLVGAALVLLWRWYRDRRPGARYVTLSARRLANVWKAFLRNQPERFRDAVAQFPVVVVLGAAGSGKSALVDGLVDWVGEARQFLPSSTDDPLIQIYLGRAVVVIELSAALLDDDSPASRKALLRLWRTIPGLQPPTALVVLDGKALQAMPPAESQNHARLIRGKINLISEVYEAPVRTRVCVTHMDGVAGYAEFDRLLRDRKIAFDLKLDDLLRPDQPPAATLAPYENLVAPGLTDLSSEEFLRLVRFFARAGDLFQPLSSVLASLTAPEPLSPRPDLDHLRFFAPGLVSGTKDLFRVPAPEGSRGITPKVRLAIKCAAVAAGFGLILGLFGLLMASEIGEAHDSLDALQAETIARERDATRGAADDHKLVQSLEASVRQIATLEHSLKGWPILSRSFQTARRELHELQRFSVRRAWLTPIVENCGSDCLPERSLYALGAIYATRDGDFGKVIEANARDWAIALGVPEVVVRTYLDDSAEAYRLRVNVPQQSASQRDSLAVTAESRWYDALAGLEEANAQESISPEHLQTLKNKVAPLMTELATLRERYPFAHDAYAFLVDTAPINTAGAFEEWLRQSEDLRDVVAHRTDLLQNLTIVWNSTFEEDKVSHESLLNFLSLLDHLASATTHAAPTKVVIREHVFTFDPQAWSALLERSLVRIYSTSPGLSFLPRSGGDVLGSADRFAVTSSHELGAPPYSRATIEIAVQPALLKLNEMMESGTIDPSAKRALALYVHTQTDDFARAYAERMQSAFDHCADTMQVLPEPPTRIGELVQPSSFFAHCLKVVADNVPAETISTGPLSDLEKTVSPFRAIARVMEPGKEGAEEPFHEYVSIVDSVVAELGGRGTAQASTQVVTASMTPGQQGSAGGKPMTPVELGPPGGFWTFLSPVGRVTLAMVLQAESSPLRRLEAWLDKSGIQDERLRRPFLAPVWLLFDDGRTEISRVIATEWSRERKNLLDSLFTRFPFKETADAEVDPAELDVFKWPDGRFWTDLKLIIAPLCVEKGNQWQLSEDLLNPPVLPPDLLPLTNRLGQFSRTLWDKEGKPRMLAVSLEALPLPANVREGTYAVLSYLRTGPTTIFGFNQQPTWESLNLAWWDQGSSSVGVKVAAADGHAVRAESVETAGSAWSFYRLLRKATIDGSGNAEWTISMRESKGKIALLPVRFVIRGNPWAAFRVTQSMNQTQTVSQNLAEP